jgi:hypothetical protein
MRPHHHTLDRIQVHRSATRYLQEHLAFSDYKRKVTAPTLRAVGCCTWGWRWCCATSGSGSISRSCRRRDEGGG